MLLLSLLLHLQSFVFVCHSARCTVGESLELLDCAFLALPWALSGFSVMFVEWVDG